VSDGAYLASLLALAARRRDPLRLAMALRAQYPDWGARATHTAYSLRDLLDLLDWPLDLRLAERFEAFARELAPLHAEPLWTLRRRQVRQLIAVIERPQPLQLRAHAGAAGVDDGLAPLLITCANRGLTLADVRRLAGSDDALPHAGLIRPGDLADAAERAAELGPWREALSDLEVRSYIDLVRRADRDHHPDVLRAAGLRDLAALARAAMPSAEQRLEASLAELMDGDDDDDGELAQQPRRPGALQA